MRVVAIVLGVIILITAGLSSLGAFDMLIVHARHFSDDSAAQPGEVAGTIATIQRFRTVAVLLQVAVGAALLLVGIATETPRARRSDDRE